MGVEVGAVQGALFNAPFIDQNRSSIDANNSSKRFHFWPLSTRFMCGKWLYLYPADARTVGYICACVERQSSVEYSTSSTGYSRCLLRLFTRFLCHLSLAFIVNYWLSAGGRERHGGTVRRESGTTRAGRAVRRGQGAGHVTVLYVSNIIHNSLVLRVASVHLDIVP